MLPQTISPFVSSQLPEFVREDYPLFVAFLQAYYAYLDSPDTANNIASTNFISRNLLSYKDVDDTTPEFLSYFLNDFLPNFPPNTALDTKKLLKHAKQFYKTKGSEYSLKFLFNVLYNRQVDVYYPKKDILKASDGKWQQPLYIKLIVSSFDLGYSLDYLVKRIATGSSSAATCIVEGYTESIDPVNFSDVILLFVSNVTGTFLPDEQLVINFIDSANVPHTFTATINGAIGQIVLTKGYSGLSYNIGDPVIVFGGLNPDSTNSRDANAIISQVSTGEVVDAIINYGGYGFRTKPYATTNVISAIGDTGGGAAVDITGVDVANGFSISVNSDCIDTYASVLLSASDYGFQSGSPTIGINSTLSAAFNFESTLFSPLSQLLVTNTGGGYRATPTITFKTTIDTELYNASISQEANVKYAQDANTLGIIAGIRILNPGTGYVNVGGNPDVIKLQNQFAGGASFSFTTSGTGSITGVTINSRGWGYFTAPDVTIQKADGSPSTGTGAVLQAFTLGSGQDVSLAVDGIGKVQGVQITDTGFDYISKPNVSFRIMDVYLKNLGSSFYLPGTTVYQGADIGHATFVATVKHLDIPNQVIRVFNYQGAVNSSLNLYQSGSTTNTNIDSLRGRDGPGITQYGDGNARGNVIFKGGIIQDQGFYLNDDGFLSAGKYLQDSKKYHNFSYVVKTDLPLDAYKSSLMKIFHPAGMSMLAEYPITKMIDASDSMSPPIFSKSNVQSGSTISVNSFATSGNVVGTGTSFTQYKANDILIITQGDRVFAPVIESIVNNIFMTIEANLKLFGTGTANVSAGSNDVTYHTSTSDEILAGDVLRININNSDIYLNVNSIVENVINSNITFSTSNNSILYEIYPRVNTAITGIYAIRQI